MNINGIIIGLGAFLIIGIFHPVVIKVEYHWGKKAWPLFLILGLISIMISAVLYNMVASALFGVLGFTLFWSIKELFEQERRVKKGWFPANPLKDSKK